MAMWSMEQVFPKYNARQISCRIVPFRIDSFVQQKRLFGSSGPLKEKWTKDEIALLLKLRDEDKLPWPAISKHFPGRTHGSIRARHGRSSFKQGYRCTWTQEEHNHMMDLKAAGKSWKEVAAALPGRSLSSLYTRWTNENGGPAKENIIWSPEEDARLLALREQGELLSSYLHLFPGRTQNAIARRYTKIGPRGKTGRLLHTGYRGFNDEDRETILTLQSGGKTPVQIHAEFFPERPLEMVKNVIKLGRRGDEMGDRSRFRQRWSRADDKLLLRMRQEEHKTFKEISSAVGRSYLSTTNRYYKITEGTVRPKIPHPNEYSPAENAKIVQMLKAKTPVKKIAASIGRSPVGVFHKLFSNRAEMGYAGPVVKSWSERRIVGKRAEKLRAQGMLWKEIQSQIPGYTISQLKDYRLRAQGGELASNYPKEKTPLSKEELQDFADRVRKLRVRGLSWTDVGLRFPQYSVNRIRSLYVEANQGSGKKYTVGKPPAKGRSSREVDVDKIAEYRAKHMTWKEIQAHMPDWSESTLQRAYGKKEPRLIPLGKKEVRKIAKLRAENMKWADIQAQMSEFSDSRLRKAYAQGKKEGFVL